MNPPGPTSAIVPLNVVALRVNRNDETNIVNGFRGAAAAFDKMPWLGGVIDRSNTGDQIIRPVTNAQAPQNPLHRGIHLHAELPDYYRRGIQPAKLGEPIWFPHVPNRFLVTRYLSLYQNTQYQPVSSKSWIVESDYISVGRPSNGRPVVSVPLPSNPALEEQPYMFMGRVLDYEKWNPTAEPASNYLPSYIGLNGKPLYLTSVGFAGADFASYYPECLSVFGFWDSFSDQTQLYDQIKNNSSLQFKVSYQVIGWVQDSSHDALADIGAEVTRQYDHYVIQCLEQKVEVVETPATFFVSITNDSFRWLFHTDDIPYTLNPNKTVATVTVPERAICAGVTQEIVWNMLNSPSKTFLGTGDSQSPIVWREKVELAAGNTTIEALSALLKYDVGDPTSDPDVLKNYELLLDALQLGLLHGLEDEPNKLITLDEKLHTSAFSKVTGGSLWVIEQVEPDTDEAPDPDSEITLPLPLAEKLYLLNAIQKRYDQDRAGLEAMRRQLFLDWFRYIKMYVGETIDPYVKTNVLGEFIYKNGPCELSTVIDQGKVVGLLTYQQNDAGEVIGLNKPTIMSSLAGQVYDRYEEMLAAIPEGWQLSNVPAPAFYRPTEPVLLAEGDMLQPVRRNGDKSQLTARLNTELLTSLGLTYNSANFTIPANSIPGLPIVTGVTPMREDIQAIVNEAALLVPTLAPLVANALKSQGGANNPAVSEYDKFVQALQSAQGGLSPLEGGPGEGLFAQVRTAPFVTKPNPEQKIASPIPVDFTFTNSAAIGWPPDPIGWTAQMRQALGFGSQRLDPFLPVWLVWEFRFYPLVRNSNSGSDYAPDNLTRYFRLNSQAIDYQYIVNDGVPVPFVAANALGYGSSVVLSKKPVYSLTEQIENYIKNYPDDPANDKLKEVLKVYAGRKIVSQTLSGFNIEQILSSYIPSIAVQDLLNPSALDVVTAKVRAATTATKGDNWYDSSFNNQEPIATGPLAQANFGPLRSGFVRVQGLTIVDVFGQLMSLNTGGTGSGLDAIAAFPLQPLPDDTVHKGLIYLPPRVLPPSRLWFRWLSATYSPQPGVPGDFVELNSHPATSPICGWVVPNHLDRSLFFYNANGDPIGSFGLEHGEKKYRTRAGNLDNPKSELSLDIGDEGAPIVNASLATFMWYVDRESTNFLIALMKSILDSDGFINPANYAQDPALSVLIGRPLALTRAVLGVETLGGVLPISQASTSAAAPFPSDVNSKRFQFSERQVTSTATLGTVLLPVRLGNLTDLDDGLVGYLIEGAAPHPYKTFYSPSAPENVDPDVRRPVATTVQLTLNQQPIVLTMLVDPRSGVHATSGVLPVNELSIPPDQYAEIMHNLAVTFFTAPVLEEQTGLVVALPQETGFDWQWIPPGALGLPLKANAANQIAEYGYSPQTLLEGWLKLVPAPKAPSVKDVE
ncbi:MAG: hypothetical protein JO340_19705 [Acidobacteriaceae bacterium]|nr:hypothetical protein [Acidobacteriaceae bacterium]